MDPHYFWCQSSRGAIAEDSKQCRVAWAEDALDNHGSGRHQAVWTFAAQKAWSPTETLDGMLKSRSHSASVAEAQEISRTKPASCP